VASKVLAMTLRVIKPSDRAVDTASGAMLREAAVSNSMTGAQGIWVGYVELPPSLRSSVHHHGVAESAIYIISGSARFYTGDDLSEVHDAEPGDFIWVPPHVIHVEVNRSNLEPVCTVVVRSTQEAIVINLDDPEGWVPAE
jgi:uncharacterized RmlC-like cupin family protein